MTAEPNLIAQHTRAARRDERIRAGLDDLERWLEDLVRVGLAEAAGRPWSAFEQMSARLVDAQAPGLARLVRDLGGLVHTAPNWPERMLIELGRLSLLIDAYRQQDGLEADLRAEVRSLVGLSEPRDTVLANTPPVHDTWDILGRRVLEGERLSVQRTWLWGRHTQRWALSLDFAAAGQRLDRRLVPGRSFELTLHFYRGARPVRAVFADEPIGMGVASSLPGQTVAELLRTYAGWLGHNPWVERIPAALAAGVPRRGPRARWWAVDAAGQRLPLGGASGWHLLALSGGQPIAIFGEWDGFALWPLATLADGRVRPVRSLAAG